MINWSLMRGTRQIVVNDDVLFTKKRIRWFDFPNLLTVSYIKLSHNLAAFSGLIRHFIHFCSLACKTQGFGKHFIAVEFELFFQVDVFKLPCVLRFHVTLTTASCVFFWPGLSKSITFSTRVYLSWLCFGLFSDFFRPFFGLDWRFLSHFQ